MGRVWRCKRGRFVYILDYIWDAYVGSARRRGNKQTRGGSLQKIYLWIMKL